MNRRGFQELAEIRLSEAQILLSAGHFGGAYYLAGYAAECALKACIARMTKRYDFPDRRTVNASYTHNLEDLLKVAQLSGELNNAPRDVQVNWAVAKEWSEESRYQKWTKRDAEGLVSALTDERFGVLTWLRRHW